MTSEAQVFLMSKPAANKQKVQDYLAGKDIFPITMELDLTQRCNRRCPGCPYGSHRNHGNTLDMRFLDKLFGTLDAQVPGLILTGGEVTFVPHFPKTLRLAKEKGFREVAIISNGGNISKPIVTDALLESATSVRISLYDWQEEEGAYYRDTLENIAQLRKRIESSKSSLNIGTTLLTRSDWNHRYEKVVHQVLDAGAHWVYFHPYCVGWDTGRPTHADQSGVLDKIAGIRNTLPPNTNIQVPLERYLTKDIKFDRMHGPHFLLHIGADKVRYVGPECKYEERYALADLKGDFNESFLWRSERMEILNQINSDNYMFVGTRHRPTMFSHYIQSIIDGRQTLPTTAEGYIHPNII